MSEVPIFKRIFKMWEHTKWGDSLAWSHHARGEGLRVHGHLDIRPRAGDLIHARMKSGRVGVFEVLPGGKYCVDPPDQFFVDVEFAGYAEDEV